MKTLTTIEIPKETIFRFLKEKYNLPNAHIETVFTTEPINDGRNGSTVKLKGVKIITEND